MILSSRILKRDTGLIKAAAALKNKQDILKTKYIGRKASAQDEQNEVFTLEKTSGKDFVILNLTDMHFADYDIRAFMAFTETLTMTRLVKAVKPDLITVTGDLICSDSAVYSIKRLCRVFESWGIPWAPVFGNHDDETNVDNNYAADIFLSCPHCVFCKNSPDMGIGNYIINVTEGDRITDSLFMMDSHHSQPNERQKEWFVENASKINLLSDNRAEISLFFHIPLPEYQYAYDMAFDEKTKKWREGFKAYGEKHEEICCEKKDGVPVQRGFFDAIKSVKTAKYVFCGHEHIINFSILYEGIRLTYTMKVGKASGGGYGLNGGTVIRIGENGIKSIEQKTVSYGPIINKEIIITE